MVLRWTNFGANTFWRLRWGRSIERSRDRFGYEEIVINEATAIYNGIMYHQFSYVDSNYSGDNVAGSINTYTGSASPSSYYVQ